MNSRERKFVLSHSDGHMAAIYPGVSTENVAAVFETWLE